MSEHDDDLESEVIEGSEEEMEQFPNTGDELDKSAFDREDEEDEDHEDPPMDDDPAEL